MGLEVQNQQPHPLQLFHVRGVLLLLKQVVVATTPIALVFDPAPTISWDLFSTTRRVLSSISRWEYQKFLEPEAMSRRNGPKLDLKLNLSPPRANLHPLIIVDSPGRSSTVSATSPPSSCVSSELNLDESLSTSPEATSMVLVGCPRCLMYVMLAEEDPKCPKCKSTVLLDVIHQKNPASCKKSKNC